MASTPFYFFRPADNVAPNATVTIGTGSEDTDYPKENLADITYATLAAPAKLTGVTGAFILDFGAAQRVDYVVLWHNFDAALATSVQMNATNSWGGPTVTTSPTIPAKRADGYTRKVGVDLRSVSGYSAGGFRYLRINVSGSNSVPIGLKVLAFSSVRQLSRNFLLGLETTERQTPIVMQTDARVPWAYDLGSTPRSLTGSSILSDADAESLREWFRACAGPATPTALVPDATTTDVWLVRWASDGLANRRRYVNINETELAFDEITAGDPEWF